MKAGSLLIALILGLTSAYCQTVFNLNIAVGATGYDVLVLQRLLKISPEVASDGTVYFGEVTDAAVRRFQTEHSIPATGYVGPLTRAVLNGVVTEAETVPGYVSIVVSPNDSANLRLRVFGKKGKLYNLQVSEDFTNWTTVDSFPFSIKGENYVDHGPSQDDSTFFRLMPN